MKNMNLNEIERGFCIIDTELKGEGSQEWINLDEVAKILGHTRVAAEKLVMKRVENNECRVRFLFNKVWFNKWDIFWIKEDERKRKDKIMNNPDFAIAMQYNWDKI